MHVGARLDPPADQPLQRCGEEAEQADDRQDGDQHTRVARAVRRRPERAASDQAEQPSQRAHARGRHERSEQRAVPHVVLGRVPEFVCDDRPDLFGRGLVEQVVVDDDPPGRAESGHVGVERAGATRGVGDEDVVDRHAVVLGHLQSEVFNSPSSIGLKRLNTGSTSSG